MIVNLPSDRVRWTEEFLSEFLELPEESQEALNGIIARFLRGERLSPKQFKIFWIDGQIRVLEFKVKDHAGNWRAIAVRDAGWLVLVHAFHKKTQQLSEQVKRTIRARVRRVT